VAIVQGMTSAHTFTAPKVVGLSASATTPSRTLSLLRAGLHQLRPAAERVTEVDVRSLPSQALLHAEVDHPLIASALHEVHQADIVLVATPIYKAAYSGLLKVFLDLIPQQGLRGKIVLPLATGGSTAHLLALDYALKPVLSALGARHILDVVYATDSQFESHDLLGRQPNEEVLQRLRAALAPLSETPSGVLPLSRLRAPSPERVPC
jgi:FMN reductase